MRKNDGVGLLVEKKFTIFALREFRYEFFVTHFS